MIGGDKLNWFQLCQKLKFTSIYRGQTTTDVQYPCSVQHGLTAQVPGRFSASSAELGATGASMSFREESCVDILRGHKNAEEIALMSEQFPPLSTMRAGGARGAGGAGGGDGCLSLFSTLGTVCAVRQVFSSGIVEGADWRHRFSREASPNTTGMAPPRWNASGFWLYLAAFPQSDD